MFNRIVNSQHLYTALEFETARQITKSCFNSKLLPVNSQFIIYQETKINIQKGKLEKGYYEIVR